MENASERTTLPTPPPNETTDGVPRQRIDRRTFLKVGGVGGVAALAACAAPAPPHRSIPRHTPVA